MDNRFYTLKKKQFWICHPFTNQFLVTLLREPESSADLPWLVHPRAFSGNPWLRFGMPIRLAPMIAGSWLTSQNPLATKNASETGDDHHF